MTRFLLAALLALSGPAMAAETHGHEEEEHHAFALGDLVVEHAWTRATSAKTADVFMLVHNLGEAPVLLSGASSARAQSAALIGYRIAGGTETAEALPAVPVPAGREMVLAPGVMAVRLSGLSAPLEEGGHLDLVLLTDAGALEIEAEIGAADAMHHSHAGHSHLGEAHAD
ncbi:copper chaperone PCu(A)C [Poseidonocella sp. HB161398]|uniref:copper chaperone PCu(A)C n=1 Tax=Poseidonocella sp. HB161398 TaxID=2320855 RepID=UPI001107F873|nr:copper chaperone PCu(A)C [Poseidonocella sp. HB161398]